MDEYLCFLGLNMLIINYLYKFFVVFRKKKRWQINHKHCILISLLRQIQHETFLETPNSFRYGIASHYTGYLELANKYENPTGDYDKLTKCINDFNVLYDKIGYKIYTEFSAGGILFSIRSK